MRLRHYYSCFAMAHKRIQIWQCSRIQTLRDCGKTIKEIDPSNPDLNPIEHVWAYIDRVINKSSVTSAATLFTAVEKVWDNITQNLLQCYIGSMPKRCLAVIRARGNATEY